MELQRVVLDTINPCCFKSMFRYAFEGEGSISQCCCGSHFKSISGTSLDGYVVKSVVFDKNHFNAKQAAEWAEKHLFLSDSISDSKDVYIFNQECNRVEKTGQRIKSMGNGVLAIYAKKDTSPVIEVTEIKKEQKCDIMKDGRVEIENITEESDGHQHGFVVMFGLGSDGQVSSIWGFTTVTNKGPSHGHSINSIGFTDNNRKGEVAQHNHKFSLPEVKIVGETNADAKK